jgi:hypothetical protein
MKLQNRFNAFGLMLRCVVIAGANGPAFFMRLTGYA